MTFTLIIGYFLRSDNCFPTTSDNKGLKDYPLEQILMNFIASLMSDVYLLKFTRKDQIDIVAYDTKPTDDRYISLA